MGAIHTTHLLDNNTVLVLGRNPYLGEGLEDLRIKYNNIQFRGILCDGNWKIKSTDKKLVSTSNKWILILDGFDPSGRYNNGAILKSVIYGMLKYTKNLIELDVLIPITINGLMEKYQSALNTFRNRLKRFSVFEPTTTPWPGFEYYKN